MVLLILTKALIRIVLVRDVQVLVLGLVKLAVPGFLDSGDSSVAEVEPALEFRTLLDRFLVFIFLFTTLLVVKGPLSEVAELKRDFCNLPKVHAGGKFARWVMEVLIGFQLSLNEIFHRLEIFFIEGLSNQIEHE